MAEVRQRLGMPVGRFTVYANDHGDLVTEGEDDDGRKCWRTYSLVVRASGECSLGLVTLAYSPPNDWEDLRGGVRG